MNWLKQNWANLLAHISHKWIYYIGATILVGLLGLLGIKIEPPQKPDEPIFGQGWVRDDEQVDLIKSKLEFPEFCKTPAFQAVQGDEPEEVFLWKAYLKVSGGLPAPKNQGSVGSCVGFGTTSSAETSFAVALASDPNPAKYVNFVEEVTYGGSRVEIGGGRINGDGSVGAWAAKWVENYGMVPRGVYGKYDLTKYSEKLCREFGRSGIPAEIEEKAKLHPVKDVSQVRTVAEAYKALANGWAVMVCSNQGFASRRDAEGFAAPSGSWAHCMCFIGYRKGNRPGFFCWNSWGSNWISGPKGAGDPPDGGFWVDERVAARMFSQNDSWALSDVKGFEPRPVDKLDWFIRNNQNKRFELAFGNRVPFLNFNRKESR